MELPILISEAAIKASIITLTTVGVLGAILVAIDQIFVWRLDAHEPPYQAQKFPVLGHLVGFLRGGSSYYMQLSKHVDLPISTLAMPNGRTYVVSDTRLVTLVQRHAKTISFDPILSIVAERLAGVDSAGMAPLRETEMGGQGAHRKLIHAMSPSMTGKGLDLMNIPMLRVLDEYIGDLARQKDQAPFDLWKWTRHVISIASTDAVYGPENPYRIENFKYESTFWEYESNLTMLLVNVLPRYTASRTLRAREWLAKQMIAYYRRGAWKKGSPMVQSRCQNGLDNSVPIEAIARLEVPGGTGILSNTVPTAFWTLVNVVSRPGLLASVRSEMEAIMDVTVDAETKQETWTLDTNRIRTQCPLLLAVYQETLRTRASFASPRFVLEDTLLDDRWLLKKGAILQIPSNRLHAERAQWGDDADEFNHERFLATHTKPGSTKRSPVAFRAFGGAPALCPGRHFATVEVLCFVGMLVARYDVQSASPEGTWELPPPNYGNMAASVLPPLGDIKVTITEREGVQGRNWAYRTTALSSEDASTFALASEGAENKEDSLTRAGVGIWREKK